MPSVFIKDSFRASVEGATGGKVTVLYSSAGQPGFYHVIPRFNLQDVDSSLGTGPHPAFVIGGVTRSYLYVGQFLASTVDGKALSLPGRAPSGATIDTAVAACIALGTGFHLMTAAEYSAVAMLCIMNGFQPRGNTQWGQSDAQPYETGIRVDGLAPGDTTLTNPGNLTGSGPITWRHNNDATGICDLVGNHWEITAGAQLRDGELQIMQDNDAALFNTDHTLTSTQWKAIRASDGVLIAPGVSGSLKLDGTSTGTVAGTNYGPVLYNTTVAHRNGTTGDDSLNAYAAGQFKNVTGASGVTIPATPKIYGLAPIAALNSSYHTETLAVRNYGNRCLTTGGNYGTGAQAGIFARNLMFARASGHAYRPAYYS